MLLVAPTLTLRLGDLPQAVEGDEKASHLLQLEEAAARQVRGCSP